MIRKHFLLSINPGTEVEYKRRHDAIWPELTRALKAHGVKLYSISLLPGTDQLFAFVLVDSEEQWAAIAETPECKRWWKYMAELMPHDDSYAPIMTDLKEVFCLT